MLPLKPRFLVRPTQRSHQPRAPKKLLWIQQGQLMCKAPRTSLAKWYSAAQGSTSYVCVPNTSTKVLTELVVRKGANPQGSPDAQSFAIHDPVDCVHEIHKASPPPVAHHQLWLLGPFCHQFRPGIPLTRSSFLLTEGNDRFDHFIRHVVQVQLMPWIRLRLLANATRMDHG